MGMIDWAERPAEVLQQGGVIGPDERLPWPQTAAMDVQHVIAMFGATVLAPILMGFDPNIAILMSGVGTLIFFFITGGKVPSYLGSPACVREHGPFEVAQNLDGELLTDIRDTGADPADPDVRLYRTRAEQDFHTDGADVIGLLALQAARQGGISRVVSSVRVYHELARQRPDLAELLHAPWFFHLPGGRARGLPEALPRPIVRRVGAKLETFYIGWYLRNAQGLAGVPPLSAAQHEALALYEALANDPRLFVDMDLVPGDVQWLRNCFVLHKRTGYEDWPEPERRRHLLRLWLQVDRLADGTPRFPIEGGTPG